MPRNSDVDAWFERCEHPMKDALLRVRDIILAADEHMDECIKWQSPTFTFEGNLASFNPRTKNHVSLMFHTGAAIPGSHPRLEGGGDTARYMRIADLADAEGLRGDLEAIVKSWCDLKSGSGASAAKKAATKPAAAKKPAAKQSVSQKPATKKTEAKPAAAKPAAAKKAPAKKTAAKKPAVRKASRR
jgi:hypothetical protein